MPAVMEWVDESRLFVRSGEAMVTHNLYTGLYEYFDMRFLLKYLNHSDQFLDIGANSGVYTVLASAVKKANVLAFEPIPDTYQRFMENVRLNDISTTVNCINKGLSSEPGELLFTKNNDATNHVKDEKQASEDTIRVEVSTLDAELLKHSFEPSVMKIDVEGYELFVLSGAKALLKSESLNVVIIELNDSGSRYGVEDSAVISTLIDSGFTAYDYEPETNEFVELEKGSKSERQNTLFIKDIAETRKRMLTKTNHTLMGKALAG